MSTAHNILLSAEALINAGQATCVVIKDGKIITTANGSGIRPVLEMYDRGQLSGAILVDKVIGRATAIIAYAGGAVGCYGITVSKGAYDFLSGKGVPTEYKSLPDHIINRTGTDICPMEKAVIGIDDTEAAIAAVRETLKKLSEAK